MSRLRQFLAPKAIAIAGCPGDLSRPGARPLVYLLRHGFTEAGAVRLGLADRPAVVRAARELLPLLKGRGAEGLLVQKMVRG